MNQHAADLIAFLEAEQRLIFIERTEHGAETELEALIDMGEFSRVERIIERIKERLSR